VLRANYLNMIGGLSVKGRGFPVHRGGDDLNFSCRSP
jgi:hypothetical protein